MSGPEIPDSFDINTNISGGMTLNTIMSGTINANTKMTGDPNQPLATLVIGDRNRPIAMEMLNLPRFTVADLKDMMTPKIRMRLPNYSQFCFKLFGVEVFSFCMNGEAQMITEPYVPNAYERCEAVDCCEPDTRPFPSQG